MKPSNFQFINPYLEELYFSSNPDFHPDTDISVKWKSKMLLRYT
jgi:hypothetical protein